MKKSDYQEMMDDIHSPKTLKQELHHKLQSDKQPKSFFQPIMKPILVTGITIALIIGLVNQLSSPSTSFPNVIIQVQAKDQVVEVKNQEPTTLSMQNETIAYGDSDSHHFYITSSTSPTQTKTNLLLTLPLQIISENVESITYQTNQENAYLIPRYSLEELIVGDDENTVAAIEKHVLHEEGKKSECNYYRTYQEMSDAGKARFTYYLDIFKENIQKDPWWQEVAKSQDAFYENEYTQYLLSQFRKFAYTENAYDESFQRTLRLDEYRYFQWGSLDKTKSFQMDYDKQADQSLQILISLDQEASAEQLIAELKKTTITMTFTTDTNESYDRMLSFQNINVESGAYELSVK